MYTILYILYYVLIFVSVKEDEAASAESSVQSSTRVEASTESACAVTPSIETGTPTVSGLSLVDKPATETVTQAVVDHDCT